MQSVQIQTESPQAWTRCFIPTNGTDDNTIESRYRALSADCKSIDITDDWSAFTAFFTVENEMTLTSLVFGGVDGDLDFDDFDLRALSSARRLSLSLRLTELTLLSM